DFVSDPAGATLTVDNRQVTAPASFVSWVNYGVVVQAASQVFADGSTLAFASWSDGGAATHTIVTPSSDSTYTARFSASTPSSTPFNGTPTALPGVLQVENFDEGASRAGYSDTTAENSGNQYRTTGVDVEATAGGGFNVGWAFAGEWLKYTVSVGSAGTYDLEFRVASNGAGGSFHVEANGVNVTGPMTVPDTGGWQTWSTIRRSAVNLAGGARVWRLVVGAARPTQRLWT